MSERNTSSPATPPSSESREQIVAEAINRHLAQLGDELQDKPLLSERQLERMMVLSRLRDSLTKPKKDNRRGRHTFGICFVLTLILVLLLVGYYRVSSSAAEFDVKASSMQVEFEGGGKNLSIPGEAEQALSLTHATISGIENSDLLPNVIVGDSLQLHQDTGKDAPPVRLQEVEPPAAGPFSLNLGTSYQSKDRGLVLALKSHEVSKAVLTGPLPRNPASNSHMSSSYDAVTVNGKSLRLNLYPSPSQGSITVLRNVTIKAIHFRTEEAGHGASVLGGSISERDLGDRPIEIQPGDVLEIEGTSLYVRQLIFKDGVYQMTLSSPKSSKIQLGEDTPKNLMPTFLQRWSSLWPTQLYTTLSAIVLLWLAIEKWWKETE